MPNFRASSSLRGSSVSHRLVGPLAIAVLASVLVSAPSVYATGNGTAAQQGSSRMAAVQRALTRLHLRRRPQFSTRLGAAEASHFMRASARIDHGQTGAVYRLERFDGGASDGRWRLVPPSRDRDFEIARRYSGIAKGVNNGVKGVITLGRAITNFSLSKLLIGAVGVTGLVGGPSLVPESPLGRGALFTAGVLVGLAQVVDTGRKVLTWKRQRPEIAAARAWARSGGLEALTDRDMAEEIDAKGRVATRMVPLVRDPAADARLMPTVRVEYIRNRPARWIETTSHGHQKVHALSLRGRFMPTPAPHPVE